MAFRIRDPIHNFINLPDELMPLVNSSPLQRLRGIRQLAFANLVYPGALHTRFDHTLGVTHVAGLMAKQLKLTEEETRLVQLATLLHDIGHGPFSHVSEASLSRFADRGTLAADQKGHKIHELVTAKIIETDPELCKLLPDAMERKNVCTLLKQGYGRTILKQVVSGPLDADKQDYLLRDSRFCGVEYGTFDLHQLQRSLVLDDGDLMIDPDGVHAVEQFVIAKYHMTANVYRHRVRLITDQMIGRAITLGIGVDRVKEMVDLYRFDNSDAFIRNYESWDDARFLETFCPLHASPPGKASGEVLRRLRTRELLKQVFSVRIDMFDPRFVEMLKELPEPTRDGLRIRIERATAEFLSKEVCAFVDERIVIAHAFSIKSVRESSRNEEEGIMVKETPTPRAFIEASTLFKSINEAYLDRYVEVYAPIAWPDPGKKDDLREKWKGTILDIITAACKEERKTQS